MPPRKKATKAQAGTPLSPGRPSAPLPMASSSTGSTIYGQFQSELERGLQGLLDDLVKQRAGEVLGGKAMRPVPKETMDSLVDGVCQSLPDIVRGSGEGGIPTTAAEKSRLELSRTIVSSCVPPLVSSIAFPSSHSALASAPEPVKHQLLHDALDCGLTLVEKEWAKEDTALVAIEEILETASVQEAERTFEYLETRVQRLTKGMVPERGTSLVLLRMQNNLLRRLSKSLHTVFCGRILAFLASVFPISERSGVNLRGTFNTGNVTTFEVDEPTVGEESRVPSPPEEPRTKDDGMEVEKVAVPEVVKPEAGTTEPAGEEGEDVEDASKLKDEAMQVDDGADVEATKKAEEEEKQRVAEEAALAKAKAEAEAAEKALAEKRQFYTTFWSLQPLLSNPQELFRNFRPPPGPVAALIPPASNLRSSSGPSSGTSGTTKAAVAEAVETEPNPSTPQLAQLREGILKTLEVFNATNQRAIELSSGKEKEGDKGEGKGKQRDAGLGTEEEVKEHYFFPKYLTKRNLLDLEIADPYFRRQILTQFLIVLLYIRSFSPEERAVRAAQPKPNKLLDPIYVFGPRDEWVKTLLGSVWRTLDLMVPDGNLFARTIQQILKRDTNWVLWKANSCQSFEKPPITPEEQEKAKAGFKSVTARPPANRARVGTDALTRLWEKKVTRKTMESIDARKGVPDYDELQAMIKKEDDAIAMRKMDLEMERLDEAAMAKDPEIIACEGRKTSLSWRAMRMAQTLPRRVTEPPPRADQGSKSAKSAASASAKEADETATADTSAADADMTLAGDASNAVEASATETAQTAPRPDAEVEEEEEEYEPVADEDDEEEVQVEGEATEEVEKKDEDEEEADVVNLVGEGRLDASTVPTPVTATPTPAPTTDPMDVDVVVPPASTTASNTGTPKRAREEDPDEAEAAGSEAKKVKL